MFFRDKAGPGRYSLCTDVLLCSTLAHVHYISLLSVGVRACVDLYPFFALACVYAHELGNLLGRVTTCACVIVCALLCLCVCRRG